MIRLELYPEYNQKEYVIDGANICGLSNKKPIIEDLNLVLKKLNKMGTSKERIIVICDASLRHTIDDPIEYKKLISQGIIVESPAGIKADKFILNYCLNNAACLIISNDLFREYYSQFPDTQWIKRHRIGVLKIKNKILLVPMRD